MGTNRLVFWDRKRVAKYSLPFFLLHISSVKKSWRGRVSRDSGERERKSITVGRKRGIGKSIAPSSKRNSTVDGNCAVSRLLWVLHNNDKNHDSFVYAVFTTILNSQVVWLLEMPCVSYYIFKCSSVAGSAMLWSICPSLSESNLLSKLYMKMPLNLIVFQYLNMLSSSLPRSSGLRSSGENRESLSIPMQSETRWRLWSVPASSIVD